MHRLTDIQSAIRAEGLDGWLLYDFKGLNPIALRVAGIPADRFLSRRWACFIPATGEPRWIAHAIEAGGLRDLAPDIATYVSWQSWREGLAALLAGAGRVAMEVSPGCAIPYVSRVDAGTIELVRSLGVEVATSADLVQVAEAVWTADQLASHRRACAALNAIKDATFAHVREQTGRGPAGHRVRRAGFHDDAVCRACAGDRPSAHRGGQRACGRPALRPAPRRRHAAPARRFPAAGSMGPRATPRRHLRRHHLGGLRRPGDPGAHPAGVRSRPPGAAARPLRSPANGSAPRRRCMATRWTMRAGQ